MSKYRLRDGSWNWEAIGVTIFFVLVLWMLFVISSLITYVAYGLIFLKGVLE